MSIAKTICLVACHKEPAAHFAVFAQELIEQEYRVQLYASGPALKKFQFCKQLLPEGRSFMVSAHALPPSCGLLRTLHNR